MLRRAQVSQWTHQPAVQADGDVGSTMYEVQKERVKETKYQGQGTEYSE